MHTEGYKSIGSFHSEDVDVLMAQPDNIYETPDLPFIPKHSNGDSPDFLLDRTKWTFLNHGAFGAALRIGYDRAEQWRYVFSRKVVCPRSTAQQGSFYNLYARTHPNAAADGPGRLCNTIFFCFTRYHLEEQPLRFFDRDLLPHLVYSARRLAMFCKSSRDDFTLVPNVTYGLNTILRGYSSRFKEKSHVILWDTSYGSLKKMADEYCPNKVTEIPVSDYFERLWDDSLSDPSNIFETALLETLDRIKKENDNNSKPIENALLVLDHTTSNTALNMPLEELSKLAKEMNMMVLVDGAHGALAQHLALEQLSHVDFYVGNGHKWLSCPRGIGFLYCPYDDLRNSIMKHPAVMSHGIGQGFQSRFLWDGCRDYAAALSVPAVLDYWEEKTTDGTRIPTKINAGLREAAELLGHKWHGTQDWERSLLAPLALHSPMMALVRLPEKLQSSPSTSDQAKAIQDFLYDHFIEVPIKCINGVLYVRISCHVYNEIDEYDRLAHAILQLCLFN